MAKRQKLIEELMAATGANQNAVTKVVDGLQSMKSDDVDVIIGRSKPKPEVRAFKSGGKKSFKSSGSEEVD